ncbi:2'-5' RNA ligase family protein [Nocardia amamiensis]|uniref:2'-5' RNA ligase family protein n=1 Tax=Nocardia amamiensis TaxID=404578 RepID=A0ABS0CYK8_9NOCA|nr:2'-5' RNA ligase family protein [Nocardia amamiensis]MBF6301451.1 2'-5' RNA ligase family protein [Nocardia amamiensis]
MAEDSTWDHWWWRPGWKLGKSFYTWHVTFDNDSPAAQLVETFAPTLSQIPTMDPVAREGLHITIQGIGFTDDATTADVQKISGAAATYLSRRGPFDALIGPPSVDKEAIGLPIANPEPFRDIRDDLQLAIADVWGVDQVPERGDRFNPHLSLAYSTGVASMTNLRGLLARNGLSGIEVVQPVAAVSLIALNRDNHRYEWREITKVPLGIP